MIKYIRGDKRNIYESRQTFLAAVGQEIFDKYMRLRNKIPADHPLKDMDKAAAEFTPEQINTMLDKIESRKSNTERMNLIRECERAVAEKGATLLKEENGWKVYEIKTFEASAYYGRGTVWCISATGQWEGEDDGSSSDNSGRGHWNTYKRYGVKFFFVVRGNEKYAIAYEGGTNFEIYNKYDEFVMVRELPDDFPEIEDVAPFMPRYKTTKDLTGAKNSLRFFFRGGEYNLQTNWFTSGQVRFTTEMYRAFDDLASAGYNIAFNRSSVTLSQYNDNSQSVDDFVDFLTSGIDREWRPFYNREYRGYVFPIEDLIKGKIRYNLGFIVKAEELIDFDGMIASTDQVNLYICPTIYGEQVDPQEFRRYLGILKNKEREGQMADIFGPELTARYKKIKKFIPDDSPWKNISYILDNESGESLETFVRGVEEG